KRVFGARDQLTRLLLTPSLPEPLPAQVGELARLADDLEGQLQEHVEAVRTARETQLEEIRAAIGNVRGISLPTEWLRTELTTHLAGIGATLRRMQAKLIDALRKEADRIQEELATSADDRFG